MPRRQQLTIRTGGLALALSATLLSGCASATVDGRAAASGTPLTLAAATSSESTSPPPTAVSTSPTGSHPATVEDVDDMADTSSYTDLQLGDPVTVWDDNGEADLYVRSATFADGADLLEVTVDYECYDGQCPFYVRDWTVTDAAGKRYRPVDPSGFGDTEEQNGVLQDWAQKRGHLYFDVPAGAATVEFDAASGDPATWLVPAA